MMRALTTGLGLTALAFLLAGAALPLVAQETPADAVAALQAKLDRGEASLVWDEKGQGWLRSVLKALDVPEESQVLPFAKASLQFTHISPKYPRAVYFNDDVSVAAVVGGDVLEIMANNPRGGVSFYTLPTSRDAVPRFEQQQGICVACHALVGRRVTGWMVSDITTTHDGQPQFPNPVKPFSFTDHTVPFEIRWGGWYVTGQTGEMRHRGNVTSSPETPYDLPVTEGLNLTDLSDRFDPALVLQPGSDVVALMVLEHQAGFINRAFALNILYTEEDAQQMAEYMTFADEIPLPSPVKGSSAFAARFAMMGPRDAQSRSLRDFDLQTRLFRHPLSYMIHSEAFAALRPDTRTRLLEKVEAILRQTQEGRDAMAIAAATNKDLPESWKTP